MVLKDKLELQAHRVLKVKILLFQDHLVLKAKLVQQVQQEWQAQRVLQGHKELLGMMVLRVLTDKMVWEFPLR
tara:strand:+ start:366 stop:584 length:219 start_codon:yes stop_codon:yes gene_type:complete